MFPCGDLTSNGDSTNELTVQSLIIAAKGEAISRGVKMSDARY